MEHCPQDILHSIFALACNDGGFTAWSLSFVSWTICEKSHYSRFHSIACYNVAQMLSFARILDSTLPHLRVVQAFLVCNSCKDNQLKPTSVFRGLPSIFSLIHSNHPSEPMQPYSGHRCASGQSCTLCSPQHPHNHCTNSPHSVVVYWLALIGFSAVTIKLPSPLWTIDQPSIRKEWGASTAALLVRSSTVHHCNALLLQCSVVS